MSPLCVTAGWGIRGDLFTATEALCCETLIVLDVIGRHG